MVARRYLEAIPLPDVPVYTDRNGNAVGTQMFLPEPNPLPLPKESGAHPLWNALDLFFPPPTWPPTPLGTQVPAVHGPTSFGQQHLASLQGGRTSSLNRSQNFTGDAEASSLFKRDATRISVNTVLDQIQEVGYTASVEEVVAAISALLEQERASGGRRQVTGRLRLEVFRLFCKTLSAASGIRLSCEGFSAAADGRMCPSDTKRALDVSALLLELIKAKVTTSGDLVSAAALLYKHRHCQGYIPLLYLLLEAGKEFVYTYGSITCLTDMKRGLQAEKRPMVNEIIRLIDAFRCAPRA